MVKLRQKVTISLNPEMVRDIDEMRGLISRSAFVDMLLLNGIEEYKRIEAGMVSKKCM